MEENFLKLNEAKTEVLLIAPPKKQHHLNNITFTFGSSTIIPSQKIKNLGCWWNTAFTMATQTDYIARICNFQLRKINRIKRYLTPAVLKTVIQSLVISRLNYGNFLLLPYIAKFVFFHGIFQKNPISARYRFHVVIPGKEVRKQLMNTLIILIATL